MIMQELLKSRVHLGTFGSLEEAVAARKDAEVFYGYHPNHRASKEVNDSDS